MQKSIDLKKNIKKLRAVFLTHGHEDHIGAIVQFFKDFHVPVYGTRFTIELVRKKLAESHKRRSEQLMTVKYGDVISAGAFQVEFIRVNHSIPGSSALAIQTPVGMIVHTGDFKVDLTPVSGFTTDLTRFAELGKAGVLAVLNDSTNAMLPGFSLSERSAGAALEQTFLKHFGSRLVIATFASNIDRIQQVYSLANKYGYQVVTDGRSMDTYIPLAKRLHLLKPETTRWQFADTGNPEDKIVYLVTGSQGEPNASLAKLADKRNSAIELAADDTIVFSSSVIPGNEQAIMSLKNQLLLSGGNISPVSCHASGHACADEIKLIYALLKPKHVIPIHGEPIHRNASCGLAAQVGIPEEQILLVPHDGCVVELTKRKAVLRGTVQCGYVPVASMWSHSGATPYYGRSSTLDGIDVGVFGP